MAKHREHPEEPVVGSDIEPTDPTSVDPAGAAAGSTATGPGETTAEAGQPEPIARAPKQTFAGRVWVAIGVAVLLLVLVIIFIAENTKSITVSFLGAHGHISEAFALLLAGIVGVVITLLVGSARMFQLSRDARRTRRKLRNLT